MIMYFPEEKFMADQILNHDPAGSRYMLSYSSLREDFRRYTMMSNEEFMANITDILHFACIVCWMKELQTQWILSDVGIIHELVHLLPGSAESTVPLDKIRDIFNRDCCLA
jgi:hypothetical protein